MIGQVLVCFFLLLPVGGILQTAISLVRFLCTPKEDVERRKNRKTIFLISLVGTVVVLAAEVGFVIAMLSLAVRYM